MDVNIPEQLTLTVSLRGSREVRDGYQLFRLTGQLDAFSEPAFRRVMLRCIDEGPVHLILDLSTIDFMDSSGLGVLVQIVKKIQVNQGSLQIVTNPRVTQTVKLVRLEQFLSLVNSLEEAQAGLLAPSPTVAPIPEELPEANLALTPAPEPLDRQDIPSQDFLPSREGESAIRVEEPTPAMAKEIPSAVPSATQPETPPPRSKRNRTKAGAKTKEAPEPSALETPPPPETLEPIPAEALGAAADPTLTPEPLDRQDTPSQDFLPSGEAVQAGTAALANGESAIRVEEPTPAMAKEIPSAVPSATQPKTSPPRSKRNRTKAGAKTKEAPKPSTLETLPPPAIAPDEGSPTPNRSPAKTKTKAVKSEPPLGSEDGLVVAETPEKKPKSRSSRKKSAASQPPV